MQINHRISSYVFAVGVGLLVAFGSWKWASNTDRGQQRAIEEGVVRQSRLILESYLAGAGGIEISDPLNRVREAGKVYIYPLPDGWELSGQYRRSGETRWRPYLMRLDADSLLLSLWVRDEDPGLQQRAAADPLFEVVSPR